MDVVQKLIEQAPWLMSVFLAVFAFVLVGVATLLYRAIRDGREVTVFGIRIGPKPSSSGSGSSSDENIEIPPSVQHFHDRKRLNWHKYQSEIKWRFWACGTSLIGVCERGLVPDLMKQGVSDIKILLPATGRQFASYHQLDLYGQLSTTDLVYNQVHAAEQSRTRLSKTLQDVALDGENEHLRTYGGFMHSNITISDDCAFISFYDSTGVGDQNITLLYNKLSDPVGYRNVELEFLRMWEAPDDYGRIRRKKGTSIIFFRRPDSVLLFLRDDKPSIPYPGRWDILGGNVEEGESPRECIVREMKEEIGIGLDWPALFDVREFSDRLEYTFWQPAEFDLDDIALNEGQCLKWFSKQEVQALPESQIAFDFKQVLLDFFSRLPNL